MGMETRKRVRGKKRKSERKRESRKK